MKKVAKIMTLLLAILMFIGVPLSSTFAKENKKENKIQKNITVNKKANNKTTKSHYKKLQTKSPSGKHTSIYVKINTPKHNSVYYKGANKTGEKIKLSITFFDTYEGYWTVPFVDVCKNGSSKSVLTDIPAWYVPYNGSKTYKKTLYAKKLSVGRYTVGGVPLAFDDDSVELLPIEEDDPFAISEFNVKLLKAPTKLKAKAGKKKVTLSFKKATGGKKYEIYRSTKKSKSYKKIKTTTSAKFTDKKAKKGKKYYYKIRTVRGSVKSSFTKPVRSKKVK